MSNKYDYKCPDCENIIRYKDKFCKECGCKINWEDEEDYETERNNIIKEKSMSKHKTKKLEFSTSKTLKKQKKTKNKEENTAINKNIRISFVLIMFQFIFYATGLITNNFSFKITSGDDIFVFIGYNIFLIIAIVLLLKNKKDIKSNLKRNIVFIIISIILLIISVIISQTDFETNYNSTEDKKIKTDTSINEGEKIKIDCFYFLTDDYETSKQVINELDNGLDIKDAIKKFDGTEWRETCSKNDIVNEILIEYSKLGVFEYSKEPIETEYGYYVIFRKSNEILSGFDEQTKEKFESLIEEYEATAKEIWTSDDSKYIFEEIIITENRTYKCTRLLDRYSIYEINFIKNGKDVYVCYYYENQLVDFDGNINNNILELYMDDGITVHSNYNKK